jgi:hypothetical protein
VCEVDHEAAAIAALVAADAEWVGRLLADKGLPTGAALRDDERAHLLRAAGL